MGALRYLWLVLREAWSESLDRAQAVLFLTVIVAGGAIAMLPNFAEVHHFQDVFDGLLSWKGAALTLGAVVIARLAVAPYHLWKREVDKNTVLEDRLKPQIRLDFDDKAEPVEYVHQPRRLGYMIGITNIGGVFLSNCMVEATISGENDPRGKPWEIVILRPVSLLIRQTSSAYLVMTFENPSDGPALIHHFSEYPNGAWQMSPMPVRLDHPPYSILVRAMTESAEPAQIDFSLTRENGIWIVGRRPDSKIV
jgi:hypothetical protein